MSADSKPDVIIIGAGLAGLTLSRHLLLHTDQNVLLLDRRESIPPKRQKVGESTVQVAGYYFAKVLDLESYLLDRHYMKYNLRFYWRARGKSGTGFEDFSHSYIRSFSNIGCYQLDRNVLERDLLEMNLASPKFRFVPGVKEIEFHLERSARHRVSGLRAGDPFTEEADWVVDATGRSKLLAKELGLTRKCTIDHGSSFFWVDGRVDIEKLTELSPEAIRQSARRRHVGHLPLWLATNHFMGDGFWFWVIPLRGRTSLGLVYDNRVVATADVSKPQRLLDWLYERFPLFRREFENREIIDFAGFGDFAYSCARTISDARWALTGESGRFADPLYSPGSDFIAIHNTLIADAIQQTDPRELGVRCTLYERLMRALFEGFLPAYASSYNALGRPESFAMKYVWELSVYFGFYVFPFINDLFIDKRFILAFLRRFQKLGPINLTVQSLVRDFHDWRRSRESGDDPESFFDFTSIETLRRAESTFYKLGLDAEAAAKVLDAQLENLQELARYFVVHACSEVIGDRRVLTSADFIEEIDIEAFEFSPDAIRELWNRLRGGEREYEWALDPSALAMFRVGSDEPSPHEVPGGNA